MTTETTADTTTEAGVKIWRDDNGRVHRDNDPAIDDSDGYRAYYIHGQLHRVDGPAVIDPEGHKEYWINGQRQHG